MNSSAETGTYPRVLIVDDHALVRHGVMEVVSEAFPAAEFGEAGSSAEGLHLARSAHWDLVILDLTLPGRGGLDLLKDITADSPHLPVLVLTMHPERQFATRAIAAGAAGYLTKASPNSLLLEAVTKILAGGRFVTRAVGEVLAAEVAERNPLRGSHEVLSDREYLVFLALARGTTVSELAAEINLSIHTISTYRSRVLHKMGMQGNAQLAQYATRNGLID